MTNAFELTPEQQVKHAVRIALLGPEGRAGSMEASVMVIAEAAFRAGQAAGHINGDIPQLIYEQLPKDENGYDKDRAQDFYHRIFRLVMGDTIFKQEVRWAFQQGARQNG